MSSSVMSSDIALGKLENIEQMPLSHSERHSMTREVVYGDQDVTGDVAQFIVSLTNIDNDSLLKILVILEKYDEFALSFGISSYLPRLFTLVESQLKSNSKVLSVLLEFFLKAAGSGSNVPRDNIVVISGFGNRCIQHSDLEVANVATKLIDKLIGLYPHDLIASTSVYIQSSANSTIQLRFVALLTHQASLSSDLFNQCAALGVIDTVVRLCQEPDILMQINALDFLPPLASTQAGLNWLCDKGVLSWLINVACEQETSASFDPVLCTETLRVLGAVFNKASALSFDLTVKLPANHVKHFLDTVLVYFEDRDETHRIAAVGILCDFAKVSLSTLKLVIENKRLVEEWMGLLKSSSKPEMSGVVLHSIARVLYQEDGVYAGSSNAPETVFSGVPSTTEEFEARKQSVIRLKKQLLLLIDEVKGVHYAVYLLKMATSPITAVRYAALDVMAAMASQSSGWGLLILSQAQLPDNGGGSVGFVSYLTNRETEYCKEGKEWKFSLIKAIHLNPARHMLSESFNKSVDLMVAQGPFYMPPRMAEMFTV